MGGDAEATPIKLAIIGGGMGGLCLANALLQFPHISVQIYEAAHQFSEIGAGVAFGPNAQRALRIMSPAMEQAYLDLVTHNTWKELQNTWFEFRFGMGPKQEELITAPKNETGQSTLHRAKFLDAFVALLPKEICHFGKRLDKIEQLGDAGGVLLHFKDGTTATADAAIGADGIHSIVRAHLLGADHPATNAVFTHSIAYRGLIPMNEAIEAIGERYAQNSFSFAGYGGNVMIYPVDGGSTMNIVATNSSYEQWEGPQVQPATYAQIEKDFQGWGTVVQKILKLLDREDTKAWSLWDHRPAPTYAEGKIAMIGDAAHASTPFQGQGAGQAIEDACVLQRLFASVQSVDQVPLAFKAYDRIRRPRSQKVCKTSRDAGEMIALRFPSVMDDPVAMKQNIDDRMDWMWNRDIGLEREQTFQVYEKLLRGEKLDPEL